MTDAMGRRRVVTYGRTSIDQSEGRSVDDQLAELRRWATQTGRCIVAELRDDGVSASRYAGHKKARPDWQRAMELIAVGATDELGVWEISRSTRDRAVWAGLLAACIENRVMLAVGGKLHDPADADDGFMLDLGAALAVRESAVISKRTRRAVDSRAAAGRPHGSVPYGYRRVLDPDTGRAIAREVHPEQGPIVQEIIRRLLDGEPAGTIASDLNRRGVPTATGKQWASGNMRRMMLRPTYAGLRVYHGQVLEDVTATWPALITVAEHNQLREMFADPARDKYRNATHVKHLGSGLFRCGRDGCEGRMLVHQHPGREPAYACRTCLKVSRRQRLVDELVERLLVGRLSRSDVLELLTGGAEDEDVRAAAEEVARLKGQLRAAREKVVSGDLTLDDLTYFRARWEKQLQEAERRAKPKTLPTAVFDVAGPDAAERWARQPIGTKRTVLDSLMVVTIRPAPKGTGRRFDPDLIEVDWRATR
ncbi:MAG TPA: recombinase family protein [Pseudonocardia sp.]